MDIVGNSDEDLLSKGKIKVLFNQILKVGAKGSQEKEGRPFPPMVGDGRSIDLYSLFLVVWKKGGYDSVSKSCAWSSVADELCFESSCGAPIKLVYAKYLSFMDRWMEAHGLDFKNCLEALVHGNMHKKNGMHASCELDCNGKELRTPSKQSAYASPKLDCNGPKHEAPSKQRGENLNISVIYVDSEDEKVDGNICSPTWKREPLILLLKWLKGVAKYPGDPKIGLDESGKGNPIVEKYRAQCILARKAFLLKREEYSGSGDSFAQRRQRVHPSMYEDLVRSSQRLLALQNNRLSLLASSPSKCRVPNNNKVDHIFIENHPLDSLSPLSKENPLSIDRFSRKLVPVGPYFQAQVPDRVDVKRKVSLGESGFSDDSKWLGRQIWPFKGSNVVTERESIGKGRALMCSCYLPGSVECIRSHISEKRQRLRAELGSAFFNWRFYDMGEEVSTFWTEREEQRFKALVRLNSSSLDNSFWCQASACFSAKSKEEIVSYYFNVFLLRRRSYQNRFTPRNIDSDDEEFEPGFLSNDLGVKMGMDSGSRTSICAKNSQCQDLDFMDMDMEQSVEV